MVEAGEFVEWAEVHGNFYGTSSKILADYTDQGFDVILDIDCQGARQLKDRFGQGVFVFILPPSFDELRRRLDYRNSDSAEVIERRIRNAAGEIGQAHWYDYIVVNDVFAKALEELKAIVLAERCRTLRVLDAVKKKFTL